MLFDLRTHFIIYITSVENVLQVSKRNAVRLVFKDRAFLFEGLTQQNAVDDDLNI